MVHQQTIHLHLHMQVQVHCKSTCISTWSINKPSTYIFTCKCKPTANPLASPHGPSTSHPLTSPHASASPLQIHLHLHMVHQQAIHLHLHMQVQTHCKSTCISTWSINKPSTYISTCKCKSTANPLASSHGPSTCFSHGPSTNHQQTITSMRPIQATQTLNAIEVLVCSHPG